MRDECLKLIGNDISVKENACNWEEHDGYWQSDCGIQFHLEEGMPNENNMNFCCKCGKKLVEHKEEL